MNPASEPAKTSPWIWGFFFLGGMLIGIAITLIFGLYKAAGSHFKKYAAVSVGLLLDTDALHLKSGETVKGRIVSETQKGDVTLEFGEDSQTFTRNEIQRVEKDIYTRYISKVW